MAFIVLTGSHGVGKSTLAEYLVSVMNESRSVRLIPETARELVRRGFKVNNEMTEEGFITYIHTYLKAVRDCEAELIVSDRSLFDLYLYTHRPSERIRPLIVEMLEELVFVEARNVDLYVYLPVEFSLPLDEVRPPDEAYQLHIDAEAERLLSYFDARTVVARGTIKERATIVIENLQHV